jgi:hypothetical protein
MSQQNQTDSAFYQSAVSNTIHLFHQLSSDQSGLYNGSEYPGYDFQFKKGSPFFLTDRFTRADILYDGILYKDVSILYDDLKDILVLEDSLYPIQLHSRRVAEFNISGHHFMRPEKNDLNNSISDQQFYELLFDGKISIFKKQVKTIVQDISANEGVEKSIVESDNYYIKRHGVFNLIRDQNDLIRVLNDREKEIRDFLKKNKLKFRKNKENTLLQVAGYYEQITGDI